MKTVQKFRLLRNKATDTNFTGCPGMVLQVSKVITTKQWTKGLITICGPISSPLPLLSTQYRSGGIQPWEDSSTT